MKDITDQQFGRLTALEPTEKRSCGTVVWSCRCDCGNIYEVSRKRLISGHTKSCGCLYKGGRTTHGLRNTRTYNVWASMIQRCENPSNKRYKDYGGRGITVCEKWHKFSNFYKDMGACPKGLSIERINNDLGYFPKNCKWATRKEQGANKRPYSHGPNKQRWFVGGHIATRKIYKSNNQCRFAQEHELTQICISECLRGKRKIHRGWKFKWV